MIVARLVPPGQSTPGPDACRAWRQRERKHIIGQRGARQPARVTSGSSAPPAASRPRATSADHSAGLPLGRSQCSARRGDSPVPRGRGPSPPAPLQAPSTRCSASAASAAPASARLTHLCRSDGSTQNSRIPSLPQPSAHPLTAFITALVRNLLGMAITAGNSAGDLVSEVTPIARFAGRYTLRSRVGCWL
jgi:hypothetical protein